MTVSTVESRDQPEDGPRPVESAGSGDVCDVISKDGYDYADDQSRDLQCKSTSTMTVSTDGSGDPSEDGSRPEESAEADDECDDIVDKYDVDDDYVDKHDVDDDCVDDDYADDDYVDDDYADDDYVDDDYVDDEGDDELGSLPDLHNRSMSAVEGNYGLAIPLAVSSMSFDISYATSYTSPSMHDRPDAYDSVLSDDASATDVDEDYSAYESFYTTYTDFSAITSGTEYSTTDFSAITSGTEYSTTDFSAITSGTEYSTTDFSAITSGTEYSTTDFSAITSGTDNSTNSSAMVPVPAPAPTQLEPITAAALFGLAPAIEEMNEPIALEEKEEADTASAAKEAGSNFCCFADTCCWLQLPFSRAAPEEGPKSNAAANAIVSRSQSTFVLPSITTLSAHRRLGREDLIRLAIATILKLVAEHTHTRSNAARAPTANTHPVGTSTSLVRYQPPTTCAEVPRPPVAPTATDTGAPSVTTSQESAMIPLNPIIADPRDELPSMNAPSVRGLLTSNIESEPDEGCACTNEALFLPGCVSFYMDMLFGSADLATGVMVELDTNGLITNAAEKFSSLDEDAQTHFINRNNHLMIESSSHPLSEAKFQVEKAPGEEGSKSPTPNQLTPGTSSSREREEAFFQALLGLLCTSICNAAEEIANGCAESFADSATVTKESVERIVTLTAPKAVAKIIETDLMEELEASSHEGKKVAVEKDDEVGVEYSFEQHKHRRRSKPASGISRYLHPVKNAKARLATAQARKAASTEKKKEKKITPVSKAAVSEEKVASTEKTEKKTMPWSKAAVSEEKVASTEKKKEKKTISWSKVAVSEEKVASTEKKEKKTMPWSKVAVFEEKVASTEKTEKKTMPWSKVAVSEEKEIETKQVNVICQRIVQEHAMRKRKVEAAKKKAIQRAIQTHIKSRSPNAPSTPTPTASEPKVQTYTGKMKVEVSDACHNVVKKHVRRKKKADAAKKKAIQNHMQKSRSSNASNASSLTDSETGSEPQVVRAHTGIKEKKKVDTAMKAVKATTLPPCNDDAKTKLTTVKRSPPTRKPPKAQQQRCKKSTGLKKTKKPRAKICRE